MNALRSRLGVDSDHESGMSLIEVVVAMVILGMLATASLSFYTISLATAAAIQHRQIAITIANESMETVGAGSVSTSPATGMSTLFTGRAKARVMASWNASASIGGVSQTYPAWDPTATATSTAAIPLTRSISHSGTDFTAETLIGKCFQRLSGGDCTVIPGSPSSPAVAPSGYTPLIRVIVIVRWTADDSCAVEGCFYETTTLIDTNRDLEWNTDD